MTQPIHEVIIDLLISYSTKEQTPSVSEILSIENALPYVEEYLEPGTFDSYVEWIQRNKERHEDSRN